MSNMMALLVHPHWLELVMKLGRGNSQAYRLCEALWKILQDHVGNPSTSGSLQVYTTQRQAFHFGFDPDAKAFALMLSSGGLGVDRRGVTSGGRSYSPEEGVGMVRSFCGVVLRYLDQTSLPRPISEETMRGYYAELGLPAQEG